MIKVKISVIVILLASANLGAQEKQSAIVLKEEFSLPSLEIPTVFRSVKADPVITKDIDWAKVTQFDASSITPDIMKTVLTDKVMGIYSLDDLPAIQRSVVVRPALFVIDRCKD